jgi:hypothetical protein
MVVQTNRGKASPDASVANLGLFEGGVGGVVLRDEAVFMKSLGESERSGRKRGRTERDVERVILMAVEYCLQMG